MNPIDIINRFYQPHSDAWNILVGHSQAVADLAVHIAQAHPELGADIAFVHEAAMLHDIGICKTSAPSIFCFGSFDYICHGFLGSQMLSELGFAKHALVCERHTGAGLSLRHIQESNLPLPHRDMIPLSIEEQIVCYADKFFSKSKRLDEQKSYERALASVQKHSDDEATQRFVAMHQMFATNRIK